jgi:PiT family inorganic phosphate transporter
MDWLTLLIILALVFGFLNGFHDSSNVVATIIFSRVMHPRWVLVLTALAEFAGPFLFGVAVAKTIGADVILAEAISPQVLAAALLAAWLIFRKQEL